MTQIPSSHPILITLVSLSLSIYLSLSSARLQTKACLKPSPKSEGLLAVVSRKFTRTLHTQDTFVKSSTEVVARSRFEERLGGWEQEEYSAVAAVAVAAVVREQRCLGRSVSSWTTTLSMFLPRIFSNTFRTYHHPRCRAKVPGGSLQRRWWAFSFVEDGRFWCGSFEDRASPKRVRSALLLQRVQNRYRCIRSSLFLCFGLKYKVSVMIID